MLWVVVFVRLALPFSFSSAISMQNLFSVSAEPAMVDVNTADVALPDPVTDASNHVLHPVPEVPATGSAPTVRSTSVLAVHDALVAVWVIVAMILLLRLFCIHVLMRRSFSSLSSPQNREISELTLECSATAGLRRMPTVLCTTNGTGPAVSGWLRPILLMPTEALHQLSKQQIRLVMLHEFRHVASGDTLVSWFQHVLCAVYWWNPFVWLAQRNWRAERELACDAWVLLKAGELQRRIYAETLLTIVESSRTKKPLLLTAGMIPFPDLLERRIRAMQKPCFQTKSHFALGILILTILAATGLTDRVRGATEAIAVNAPPTANPTVKPIAIDKPAEEVRRPVLIFAEHVILWERTEVLTPEQLVKRLAELRQSGPVQPKIYQTTGFKKRPKINGRSGTMAIFDMVGDQEYSLLSFVQGRTRTFYDSVKSQAGLAPESENARRGKVRLPGSTSPAAKAQVVILPPNKVWPGNLNLSQTTFADPVDEQCTYTDEAGNFVAHPAYDEYNVVVFHSDGYAIQQGPLKDETELELTPWETISFVSGDWKGDQKAEVWIKPV